MFYCSCCHSNLFHVDTASELRWLSQFHRSDKAANGMISKVMIRCSYITLHFGDINHIAVNSLVI